MEAFIKMHMSMMVKGPAVQTSCSNTFYRLLPVVYCIIRTSSTQLWRYRVYRSSGGGWGGGGGALTSRWQLKWMNSSSDRPNIYTSPCVNGLFPLVQYRSWVSAFGQILSNEDEAILDSIIRLYLCPSSINLDINRLSLPIGWSSRTNLHGKYILSVFM